jgi:hypothetical protein
MPDYRTDIVTPSGPKSAEHVVSTSSGSAFIGRSIAALSAGQAAGTVPILSANPARTALKVVPQNDCFLTIGSGETTGVPLYGNVENSFTGAECPVNAVYLAGLAPGTPVVIWEA